jgi:molybdopterin converting factor small subunit
MPLLQVNFYASLRKVAQRKTVGFQLPEGTNVSDLLAAAINRYPQMRAKLLAASGELDRRAHIFINGRNCLLLPEGLLSPLAVDDTIDMFPIGHF